MIYTDCILAICAIFSVVIAGFTLYQVYYQLKNLNGSLRNSTLMTLLELENEIINRKVAWDNANFDIQKYEIDLDKEDEKLNQKFFNLLLNKESTSFENYLNSLDRLSYCILNDYLSDRDWKTEYRDVIFDIVKEKHEHFSVNSRYRNIIKLFNKWKDQ